MSRERKQKQISAVIAPLRATSSIAVRSNPLVSIVTTAVLRSRASGRVPSQAIGSEIDCTYRSNRMMLAGQGIPATMLRPSGRTRWFIDRAATPEGKS